MNPVLQSIVHAAVNATGATQGWLLAVRGDQLEAVSAAGGQAGDLIGNTVPAGVGTAGFVVASGQPLAMATREGDARLGEGITALLASRPSSILCVPCEHDGAIVGALELVDKAAEGRFSFDDVEVATLLAGIAGVALSADGPEVSVPGPSTLGAELQRLASSDPAAYARAAIVLEALLAHG